MLPNVIFGQCNNEIDAFITGFNKLNASSFEFLDDKLDNIKIVGYGESTHESAEEEFNLVYHYIKVLDQFVTAINQDIYQRKMYFRDIYMSEYIEWILNNENSESRAMYCVHNDHVGDGVANGIFDATSHFLKKSYGSPYYNISTGFGTADFKGNPHNPEKVGPNMKAVSFDTIDTATFTYCIQKKMKVLMPL